MKSDLNERIEEVYNDQGWGLERGGDSELARILGVTRAAPGNWRKDPDAGISTDNALLIEEKLGYRHQWIKDGELPKRTTEGGKPKAPIIANYDAAIDEIMELLLLFKNANDVGRTSILNAARTAKRRDVARNKVADGED